MAGSAWSENWGPAQIDLKTRTPSEGNSAPVIETAAAASPATITLGSSAQLSVSASDPDGDVLTYTWSRVAGDGAVDFTSNNRTSSDFTTATFTTPGTYLLEVSVTDGDASATSAVEVTVEAEEQINRPPQITLLTADPTTVTLPATTTALELSVSDADDDAVAITWGSDGADVGFVPPDSAATTATLPAEPGAYEISVTVYDGVHSVSESVTVRVVAGGAVVPSTQESPPVVAVGGCSTMPLVPLPICAMALIVLLPRARRRRPFTPRWVRQMRAESAPDTCTSAQNAGLVGLAIVAVRRALYRAANALVTVVASSEDNDVKTKNRTCIAGWKSTNDSTAGGGRVLCALGYDG